MTVAVCVTIVRDSDGGIVHGVKRAAAWMAAAIAALGCHKPGAGTAERTSADTEAPIKVATAKVEERPMPELLTLTGTLKADQESDVAADASGKVTATFVERGQTVKRGDTLAMLDARGASLNATAAAAQVSLARARNEQARRDCERVEALRKSGAISQAEFEITMGQCHATELNAEAAQAQHQSAQKIVGDAVIRAPFGGVVGERTVNVGQYVVPSTKVASLYAPDPLRLELTVPEANVGAIKPDLPVRFSVATFGDRPFDGVVKFISPNVRASTRDLVVEAVVANPKLELRPGMFAVAHVAIGEKKLPVVPLGAVKKDEAGARLFVIVDHRVEERMVQLGGEKDGFIGVAAGVRAGEDVVLQPGADVKDGAPVR